MRYIYSYCARRTTGNVTEYLDGVLIRSGVIDSFEEWKSAKDYIIEQSGKEEPRKWTLHSLNFLHEIPE